MPFKTTLQIEYLAEANDPHEGTLLAPLLWSHEKYGEIEAPAGFLTDSASVPEKVPLLGWFFRGLLPRSGKAKFGAVIHDYIVRHKGLDGRFTRSEASDIFAVINREQRMNIISQGVAWSGVKIGDVFTRNKF